MKKLFLASAVSALFAAPTAVLAQARPGAVPTLDKVLEASGISVSGYIDASYTRADKNLEGGTLGGVSTRVFDSQNNSFGLHQFGLTVAKQPKEGFGGLVNLILGNDAQVIHSFPENNPPSAGAGGVVPVNGTSMFDMTQAYAQYATGPLTLIAGKFVTLHSTEVIASTGNANISRSILFGAVPFTHTGVRGTWALNERVSIIAGLNNGWDQVSDANRPKTFEFGASLNPIKPLTVTVSAYAGKEPTGGGDGARNGVNAVVSYTIIDPLSVGVEVLSFSQEIPAAAGATTKVKYSGVAGYAAYMFMPKMRGAVRIETFDDKNGARFGTTDPTTGLPSRTKYTEVTATVSYLAADNFELRGEVRRDQADKAVFRNFTPDPATGLGAPSKSLMTIGLQGLYKF